MAPYRPPYRPHIGPISGPIWETTQGLLGDHPAGGPRALWGLLGWLHCTDRVSKAVAYFTTSAEWSLFCTCGKNTEILRYRDTHLKTESKSEAGENTMLHWYLEEMRCSSTWECYPNLQNQVLLPCLQNPEGAENASKEIRMYLSQHLDFQAPQRYSRTSLYHNTPSAWLAQITDTMPTETLTLNININFQYIRLQINNQPTIVNLISNHESFIHLGRLLGIFYVLFILLRNLWNRKGDFPASRQQASRSGS